MASRIPRIEDDSTIGDVLASSLRAYDHEVMWEPTGRSGLAQAAADTVDLVLLGLGLPDLDGIEVCRQLRRVQPGCVLVILTALEQVVAICRPASYEIYETATPWARWLVKNYGVVLRSTDGRSLSATPTASVDLSHAHKVMCPPIPDHMPLPARSRGFELVGSFLTHMKPEMTEYFVFRRS